MLSNIQELGPKRGLQAGWLLQPLKKPIHAITPFLSLGGLLLLILIYMITVDFVPTDFHIKTIINQAAVMIVLSTGALFIFSLGSFDISLGNSVGVAVCLGIMAFNAGGGIAGMLLVCLGFGLLAGLVNSVLSSIFKMPVFIMTMAMMAVLIAILQILLDGKASLTVPNDIKAPIAALDNMWFRLGIVVAVVAVCAVLFNYTKIGRRNKMLGGNPIAAEQTGVSVAKQTIITFLISGIAVGLAAFLTITRAPTVTTSTGTSLGMDVMMAIVFGGMPLSGGPRSKISAGVVGSVSMVLLSQILTMNGVAAGTTQIYKAVLFLAVVFAASFSYREKMLSRAQMM